MVKKRRQHSVDFRIAREGLECSMTVRQLSSENEIRANLIRAWKRQLPGDEHRGYASNALCALTGIDHIRLDEFYFARFVVQTLGPNMCWTVLTARSSLALRLSHRRYSPSVYR